MKHITGHLAVIRPTPTQNGLIFCGPQTLVENPIKAVNALPENRSTRQSCMVLPQLSRRFMASWGLSARIPDLPQSSLQPSCWKQSPSSPCRRPCGWIAGVRLGNGQSGTTSWRGGLELGLESWLEGGKPRPGFGNSRAHSEDLKRPHDPATGNGGKERRRTQKSGGRGP